MNTAQRQVTDSQRDLAQRKAESKRICVAFVDAMRRHRVPPVGLFAETQVVERQPGWIVTKKVPVNGYKFVIDCWRTTLAEDWAHIVMTSAGELVRCRYVRRIAGLDYPHPRYDERAEQEFRAGRELSVIDGPEGYGMHDYPESLRRHLASCAVRLIG